MHVPNWVFSLTLVAVCGCGAGDAQPNVVPPETGNKIVEEAASPANDAVPPVANPSPVEQSEASLAESSPEPEPNPPQAAAIEPQGTKVLEAQNGSRYHPWEPKSEALKLIQAIRERPWDEQSVLKYAEWLEPTDPARAELVRTQVELEKMDYQDPRRMEFNGNVRQLETANRERWTEALGDLAVSASLRFGIVDSLDVEGFTDEQATSLSNAAPELRELRLSTPQLTVTGYQSLAKMPALDALIIEAESIPAGAIETLVVLPPWTVLKLYVDELDRDEAAKMNEARIGRFQQLSPEGKTSAACRFLAYFEYRFQFGEPTKHANLSQAGIGDAEMQLLAGLPDLESVYLSECDVTAKGIAHLAQCSEMKDLGLWDTKVESIAALSGLTKLVKLGIYPEFDTKMGDDGLAAIANFTQLNEVYLSDEEITDETVKRFANLTAMEKLELTVGELEDENCLSALAGMSRLKSLSFHGGSISDSALMHLAGLSDLETLNIRVARGSGDGFRHLGNLSKLRYAFFSGDGVNDRAMEQLTGLSELKSIMAQGSAVTPEGAAKLAEKLNHVTIILDDQVVKTPRETYTFTRRRLGDSISLLLPSDWLGDERASADSIWVREDGWERIGGYSGDQVGPSEIRMYLDTESENPQDAVMANVNNNAHLDPIVLKKDVQPLGNLDDSASCIYENEFGKHFVGAAKVDGGIIVLDCEAKAPRFDAYETMFILIGRSVQIGDDPELHADQTIEVAAEKVMPSGAR